MDKFYTENKLVKVINAPLMPVSKREREFLAKRGTSL